MNHVTIGVYGNNEYVVNIVRPEHLKDHIEYNETMRPGRMLFVDGKYVSGGCLKKEYLDARVKEWEEKISKMQINSNRPSEIYV